MRSELSALARRLLAYGNSRQLELYGPQGGRVGQMPLTGAAALGLLALASPLSLPVALGVVLLLALRFRFALRRLPAAES